MILYKLYSEISASITCFSRFNIHRAIQGVLEYVVGAQAALLNGHGIKYFKGLIGDRVNTEKWEISSQTKLRSIAQDVCASEVSKVNLLGISASSPPPG